MAKRIVLITTNKTAKPRPKPNEKTNRSARSSMACSRCTHSASNSADSTDGMASSAFLNFSAWATSPLAGYTTITAGSGFSFSSFSRSPNPDNTLNSSSACSLEIYWVRAISTRRFKSVASSLPVALETSCCKYNEICALPSQSRLNSCAFFNITYKPAGNAMAIASTNTVIKVGIGVDNKRCKLSIATSL